MQAMGNKFCIVILISGRGSNMKAVVEATLQSSSAEVVAVISDKKSAAGLDYAQSMNIKTEVVRRNKQTSSLSDFNSRLASAVREHQPDLVVLAGFMRVLSTEFISCFEGKIVNIHPSLLPSFKGLNVQQRALDAGVKYSGCSVHFVTEEVDGGPIISQAVVPVLPEDTSDTLSERILRCEHKILPAAVLAISQSKIRLENHQGNTVVKIDPSLTVSEDSSFLVSIN